MVEKFRLRKGNIEAVLYDGTNVEEVNRFTGGRVSGVFRSENGVRCFRLNTTYGYVTVYPDSYVAQKADGSYFAMETQAFMKQYQRIEE